VPISAARAERDAIAAAATAGAMRRKGPNPHQLARHIAAALNVDITDPSLVWITAVTSDGQILTANNYGLAYIPEHVHLPEQVRMVTVDSSDFQPCGLRRTSDRSTSAEGEVQL